MERRGRTLVVVVVVGLVLGVLATVVARASVDHAAATCARPLRVQVAPELSGLLTDVARRASRDGCEIDVTPVDPSATAHLIAEHQPPPDVWIPDSSVWLTDGVRRASAPRHFATSPLVLAVPTSVARRLRTSGPLTVGDLLPTAGEPSGAVRWSLPPPSLTAASVGGMLALQDAAATRPHADAVIGSVVRDSSHDLTEAGTSATAVPTSEQQARGSSDTAVYPARDAFVFDYPYAVLTRDATRRTTADRLLRALRAPSAQRALADAGFRDAQGSPTSTDRHVRRAVPDPEQVRAARRVFGSVLRPSRLLTLIDVSGSMGRAVPGAHGASRLDLAVQAASTGMSTLPDESAVGLWVFATDLTRTTDYRVLARLAPLGRGADGVSGRERLAQAMARVAVPRGPHRTGLYDSVLAAVRQVRRTWDPSRTNAVVVITDGGDSDRHGVPLTTLLSTLEREGDPERPVPVYAVAYGAGSDLASLRRISAVTGGAAYASPDPRRISAVLRDAVGRRVCAPRCPQG